jgi:hypothetical protein
MKVMQGSGLLASLMNFNVTSAERKRDAPPAGPPLTRIETCDDSQARGILWGSTGFPVAVLIPLSCILTSVLASCSVSSSYQHCNIRPSRCTSLQGRTLLTKQMLSLCRPYGIAHTAARRGVNGLSDSSYLHLSKRRRP